MSQPKVDDSLTEMTLDRNRIIIHTSVIGIVVNVLLAAFKAAVGLLSHSISVTLDAVNNLSDALSSTITILGAKLAGKLPDKKHPFGHGRIEYLSAMLVSAIVLYAGLTAGVESVKKIFHPSVPEYSFVSLLIIGVAIIVKLLLGRYVSAQGKKAHSGSLEASGADALSDAALSLSVLVCAIIYMVTDLSLEPYVGVVIACFIVRAGFDMMKDTLDDILGRRPDPEVTSKIKQIVTQQEPVRGAYDLVLNNYGPDKNYASVHVELPDTMTVEEVDRLTRRIQAEVYAQTGVVIVGVGVYSYNTKNDEAGRIRNDILKIVLSHDWALQLHGFYADLEEKTIRFDVVMSFDIDPKEGLFTLRKEIEAKYPEYSIHIAPDVDISD